MTDKNYAPYGALALRVSLGTVFLAHAALKVFVFKFDGTAGYFTSLGLPASFAYATIFAEAVGGAMLLAGVYTRYVALALIPLLVGTILFVHGTNGWLFSNEGGGWEYSAFLIAASVVQALLGDGAFALKATPLPEAQRRAFA